MKKRLFKTMVFAAFCGTMMVLFTGCKKDGVYNPKEKINRIFYESTYSSKYLSETWTWDKNLLTKITSGSNQNFFYFFEYDGKQLKTIKESDGWHCDFTYDGGKISKYDYYNASNQLEETCTFEHDGSKISKMTTTWYDNDYKDNNKLSKSLLEFMFPNTKFCKNVTKRQEMNNNKSSSTSSMTFKWDGKNISEATYEETYEGEYYSASANFEYDNKSNPYYISMYEIVFNEMFIPLSKNNITKASYFYSDGDYEEESFSYTYDGKFPIERKYFDGDYYSINYYDYQ